VAEQPKQTELTSEDWGRIHARAWRDYEFRKKLETDPTAALRDYAGQHGLDLSTLVLVKLRPRPDDIPEEFWEDVNPFPPSCC
jgi:hypothetical protein